MIRREDELRPAVRDPLPQETEAFFGIAPSAGDSAAPDASGSLPCPFCGYDVHVQVAEDARRGEQSSRCSECGEIVQHQQIVDNVRLLCEGRTPLLAFFLVPVDLFQLLFPRLQLARYAPLGAAAGGRAQRDEVALRRRRMWRRVLLVGLPLWLISAVLLFIFVALLADATLISDGCTMKRVAPFSEVVIANVNEKLQAPSDAPLCIILISSAFAVSVLVLILALSWLRPAGLRGQVQFMREHAVRRAMYVFSPVFCGLVLCAAFALLMLQGQVGELIFDPPEGPPFPLPYGCFVFLIPVWFIFRLARAGYADGKGLGAWVYVGCGLLAVLAGLVWLLALGGLLMQKNLAHMLHEVCLWSD